MSECNGLGAIPAFCVSVVAERIDSRPYARSAVATSRLVVGCLNAGKALSVHRNIVLATYAQGEQKGILVLAVPIARTNRTRSRSASLHRTRLHRTRLIIAVAERTRPHIAIRSCVQLMAERSECHAGGGQVPPKGRLCGVLVDGDPDTGSGMFSTNTTYGCMFPLAHTGLFVHALSRRCYRSGSRSARTAARRSCVSGPPAAGSCRLSAGGPWS